MTENKDALKLAFLLDLLDGQHKRRREFFWLARIDTDWMHVEGTKLDVSSSQLRKWISSLWIEYRREGDRMRVQILNEGRDAARNALRQHGKTAK
jgi:hypothetical protein